MRLAEAVENYIAHKRSLGFSEGGIRGHHNLLLRFIKIVGNIEMSRISPAEVCKYLDGTGPVTMNWFTRYYALSPFYKYALARHYVDRWHLPLTKPKAPDKLSPYIYSNQEICRLIDAADSCHRPKCLMEPHTVRMLLLLLYGTGMRIGEACRLKIRDFDREAGVLTICETKFYKTRYVPIGRDLQQMLFRYIEQQWSQRPHTGDTSLLADWRGMRITIWCAEITFRRLREAAGIYRSEPARFEPRLHDFRHTFAVVRLVTWYREGKNVHRLLPHLSTYLGHLRVNETQHYLDMTTELLEQASLCFERYARPEVPHV
jgi:site-specific recombinase XerD